MLFLVVSLCGIYVIACICSGSFLTSLLGGRVKHAERTSVSARVGTDFLLGQGVLANIWLLLSLAGWFLPQIVAGVLVICLLCGGAFAYTNLFRFVRRLRAASSQLWAESLFWKIVAFLTLFLLCIEGVCSMQPPPGFSDSALFYMVLPKTIAASHRLVPLQGLEIFSQIGLQGELHYAALMSLGSAQTAKFFMWFVSVMIAMMLLTMGSLIGLEMRGKLIALALLFTSSGFTKVITDGKVDLVGAAMGVAAFYWALQTGGQQKKLALRLTGLFTGFAIIAKASYLAVLLPGVVFIVMGQHIFTPFEKSLNKTIKSLVWKFFSLGFWMILPVIPNLIKNGLLFGEPLAPFVTFGKQQSWLLQIWFTPEVTQRIVLTYPFALVFGRYWAQHGTMSSLILAFVPLAFILPRPRSLINSKFIQITLAAIGGVMIWVILRPSILAPRYILAPLFIFIILAARGSEHVSQVEKKPRWLTTGILICLFITLLSVLYQGRFAKINTSINSLRHITGNLSECDITGQNCRVSEIVNQDAALGDRVYMGTVFSYWLRPDLLQCMSGSEEWIARRTHLKTPEEQWTYLYEQGFRYVLLYQGTHHAKKRDVPDVAHAPPWLKVIPLLDEEEYKVFRIASKDPFRQPKRVCRQVHPPAWDIVMQ